MASLNRTWLSKGVALPAEVTVGPLGPLPERILQFGEGGFLRAFVDWMVDTMNRQGLFNGSVVVVQPIAQGFVPTLNVQDGLYTLLLRGVEAGQVVERTQVVTAISRGINPYADWAEYLACAENPDLRFIVSNTTEAGIAYLAEPRPTDACPQSFPAKVTAFLHQRFTHFAGAPDAGMVIIPCELIDRNGDALKAIVLRLAEEWGLPIAFAAWVREHCAFLNTLVDRIVTGYPKDEAQAITTRLGYEDALLDTGEVFHLWVIEGDKKYAAELPLAQAGLDVLWTDDQTPYRTRKVRILNGAHTMAVLAAYLYGKNTVRECVEDPLISAYMRTGVFEEIIPTLDLPEAEKQAFAAAVFERFANPFICHELLSIALNSVSKWKVRVLPSLTEYVERMDELPRALTFSLAALIAFYRGAEPRDGALVGHRDGAEYLIKDDAAILTAFADAWRTWSNDIPALTDTLLSRTDLWGEDLTAIPGLSTQVAADLYAIVHEGMAMALREM
jgi:tagaturonate reductase